MRSVRTRPIRAIGWAFPFRPTDRLPSRPLLLSGTFHSFLAVVLLVLAVALDGPSVLAQPGHQSEHHDGAGRVHGAGSPGGQWEGSNQGIAYSELNHHVAGAFVVLIALADLRQALGVSSFAWTRFLLPGAMLLAGPLLLIWSDHDAWPIGSMTLVQTFFGDDLEVLQHKAYGLLLLAVGAIELARRLHWVSHAAWSAPLPLLAIVGGLMLFGHSHGIHPSAQKIAWHHALMGILAITAGSSKLVSGWIGSEKAAWDFLWTGLILLIGIELLTYSE